MKNKIFFSLLLLFMPFFLSGCSILGAAYSVASIPFVVVGEVADGVVYLISDDDDDDDDDDDHDDDDDDDYDDDDDDDYREI